MMIDENTFDTAWKFHTLGRCVIPSGGRPNGKAALVPWKKYQTVRPTDDQLEEWHQGLKPQVWAMPTGPVSGCFVIDCDTKEASALMEAAGLKPHVQTPKGGHYYCKWPSWVVRNQTRLLPGIDVRGQGGYVNFCSGNGKAPYEVLIVPTADTLYSIDQLPAKLREALKPKAKTAADRLVQRAIKQAQPGNRNETGLWLACQLRDNVISQAEAEATMKQYASQVKVAGAEPYTEAEAF